MDHLVEMPVPTRPPGPIPIARHTHTQRIGLLLFDGCSLLTAGIIAEAFRVANELELQRSGRPFYQLSLLSYRGGNIACSSSVRIWTQGLDAAGQRGFGAVFIACSEREPASERDARVTSAIMEVSASALERSTWGRELQSPRVSRAEAASGQEGGAGAAASVFWCRGGADHAPEIMPSAIDMALAQIEADLGPEVADEVARQLDPRRETMPEIEPYDTDDTPDLSTATANKILASARWIAEHYMEPISVADAARFAAMSERNYLRRFKFTMGMTPSEYLLQTRLDMICQLLVKTTLPVDKVARRCGMGNGDRLGKIFRKRFALSPTEYRNQGPASPGSDPTAT
ncbi:Transcriptional regulator GlxA family, contains an amidase domain and an AraC-type DNA-binding HTH domain [Ralstonia sp. 25mfcol4.1]|uniref:GlxA family transcriptional regulator n=1 Tax=Ralstonia sp. 25mfcol4.1 TaxID=1761899 RepID=UPI00087FD5FB|nr:helix-turn-helix domain-containing protein [Ralstonia sp. 25mfcol4.1]SDP79440.1 Transcriptional regulator GlxA family, contains an amidase domain and an AraC-type DNA-binding HTH domain [Ralstonia sp. 25mfcol4.1]